MKPKFTLIIALIALTTFNSFSQQKAIYSALKVGDKVPDHVFSNVINYSKTTAKISDFRGKLLILDFWSTSCASCVASWPKLLNLQKEFQDKVQIIPVNPTQDILKVRPLLDKQKKIRNVDMSLPMVLKDEHIMELFPHPYVPFVVWIDENGFVKSMSDGTYLNEDNIRKFLNKEQPQIEQAGKEAIIPKFNKPLFSSGQGIDAEQVIEQTTFTRYVPNLISTSVTSANEKDGYYICYTSGGIRDLIQFAYTNRFNSDESLIQMPKSNVIYKDVKDTSKYSWYLPNGEPNKEHIYSYQCISSPTTMFSLQKKMQEDIKRFFNIDVKWLKIKRKCLVLTAKDTTLISYKTGRWSLGYDVDTKIIVNRATVREFLNRLENDHVYYSSDYPFIDETGFSGKLGGIEFEANISDYKDVAKGLKKYGMDLQLEDREVETLVVTELDH